MEVGFETQIHEKRGFPDSPVSTQWQWHMKSGVQQDLFMCLMSPRLGTAVIFSTEAVPQSFHTDCFIRCQRISPFTRPRHGHWSDRGHCAHDRVYADLPESQPVARGPWQVTLLAFNLSLHARYSSGRPCSQPSPATWYKGASTQAKQATWRS